MLVFRRWCVNTFPTAEEMLVDHKTVGQARHPSTQHIFEMAYSTDHLAYMVLLLLMM